MVWVELLVFRCLSAASPRRWQCAVWVFHINDVAQLLLSERLNKYSPPFLSSATLSEGFKAVRSRLRIGLLQTLILG